MNIKDRFRSIRAKTRLSQKEFAKSLDVSQSAIADIERGSQEPSKNILIAIAQEYNVSLDWLLFGIELNKEAKENERLRIEIETLKKENAELLEDVRKIENEYKKLDIENREISRELVARLQQLVEVQSRQLEGN